VSDLEKTGRCPAQRRATRAVFGSAVAIPAFALLSACASAPHIDDFEASWPEEPDSSVASNGAIFQAGHDIALFENAIARRVGDTVTIHLMEETNASKSSSTTTSKTSTADMSAPTIAGLPVTVNGTEVLKMGVDNQTAFDGSGDSSQSNRLEGDVTVTVARRLANGNLLVRGQKWITINQGKEYVRIQGIIRPVDIAPDNSVPSSKVADASISYGGQGVLADANSKGWLSRFFDKPWAPF
jgi:flagellar L-ring protein precursor FlgH